MLQIATGKFFKHEIGQENILRGVLHTNYRSSFREEGFQTAAGKLTPTSNLGGLQSLIYEVVERYEGGPAPGALVSVGVEPFLREIGAVASFGLNITCTPDPDLARRLLGDAPLSPNASDRPKQYVPRTFETAIWGKEDEADRFATFVADLIALDRRHYQGAMRAIRTYVTGLQRLGDDFDLAYTLLVASVESLAQGFDGHQATWADFEEAKRKRIDDALVDAPEAIAGGVRTALLEIEHVSLARRFKAYALENLQPSYFREEAHGLTRPVGKADLAVALDQAYRIRSKYVHTLTAVPKGIKYVHDHGDYAAIERTPTLTIQGLARLARHLIHEFVRNGTKAEAEDYRYTLDIPGTVEVEMAPQYWVWQHEGFEPASARRRFSGVLELYASVMLKEPNASLVDIRDLLRKFEVLVPTATDAHRLPMVALYYLFHVSVAKEQQLEGGNKFLESYQAMLNHPSLESVALHIALDHPPGWTTTELANLRDQYMRTRYRPKALKFPWLFETALDLIVAEAHRREGNEETALAIVSEVAENHPTIRRLAELEAALAASMAPIVWQEVLLPPRPTSEIAETSAQPQM